MLPIERMLEIKEFRDCTMGSIYVYNQQAFVIVSLFLTHSFLNAKKSNQNTLALMTLLTILRQRLL